MPAPLTTVVGNLTADPELRYTQGGHAVANFTIAATERVRVGEQWQDGNTVFLRCTVWRDYAEHVAGSLGKGVQVIATGSLTQRSYDRTDGSKRTVVEFDVQDVGPALRFATAAVTRTGTAAAAADGWADSDATPSRARAAATRAA